jgi:H+/gluconate symporter-like permease
VKLLKQNLLLVQHSGCRALLLCAVALAAAQLVAQPLAVPKPEQVQASPVADAARRGDRRTLVADSFIPAIMAVIYLLLVLYFKAKGGYKPVQI